MASTQHIQGFRPPNGSDCPTPPSTKATSAEHDLILGWNARSIKSEGVAEGPLRASRLGGVLIQFRAVGGYDRSKLRVPENRPGLSTESSSGSKEQLLTSVNSCHRLEYSGFGRVEAR